MVEAHALVYLVVFGLLCVAYLADLPTLLSSSAGIYRAAAGVYSHYQLGPGVRQCGAAAAGVASVGRSHSAHDRGPASALVILCCSLLLTTHKEGRKGASLSSPVTQWTNLNF